MKEMKFRLKADESIVRTVKSTKFKHAQIARKGTRISNILLDSFSRFYAHKIAFLLFPKHFFEPVAQTIQRTSLSDKYDTGNKLYSKARFGDEVYNTFLEHFYRPPAGKFRVCHCVNCFDHYKRAHSWPVLKLAEELKQIGIDVATHPANIGFDRGEPIFYELAGIWPQKIRETLQARMGLVDTKDLRTYQKVLRLLKRYEFAVRKAITR